MHVSDQTKTTAAVPQQAQRTQPAQDAPGKQLEASSCGRTVSQWVAQDADTVWWWSRALSGWIWDTVFRLRSYGVENVPRTGGFVFAPNHSSWLDPFFQARGQPRNLRFMAKASIFTWPVVRRYAAAGGAFPVHRGTGDQVALEIARGLLRAGHVLSVYPEGTRFRASDELGPPRRGAARLALEAGAPMLPVATYGAKARSTRGERWWHWWKVTTVYGAPIHFDGLEATPENVEHARDVHWAEVQRLYDLARELHQRRRRPRRWSPPPRD
jgi:1-acyl-sn-glycerol-3-phosphate acyltransferase